MHPSIAKLLKVQAVDNEVRFLREAAQARPRELESERRKLEAARARIAAISEEIKKARITADKGELEIRRCDAEIEKANVALNQAKSNQEFAVLKTQIERISAERGQIEERVLGELDQIEERTARRKELEAEFADAERSFQRKEQEVGAIVRDLEAKLESVLSGRQALLEGIDPDHLQIYDRLLHRLGNPLSVVRDRVCQGCFMSVNNQEINALMIGHELVRCRSCSRIFYLEE